jgi:hypothetical protein
VEEISKVKRGKGKGEGGKGEGTRQEAKGKMEKGKGKRVFGHPHLVTRNRHHYLVTHVK